MDPTITTPTSAEVAPARAGPAVALDVETGGAPVHAPRQRSRWLVVSLLSVTGALAVAQVVRVVSRSPEVQVVAVGVEDVVRMLAVTGRVEAVQTVEVGPQFAGRITEIVRHEGDRVTSGDILARLEDTSAKSNIVQQQAALSSKERDFAQSQRDLARTATLVSSGASAPAELESARLVSSRAHDDLRRLTAVMTESRAQLVLVAPFDGTIVRRDGELGRVVGPQDAVFEIATVDAPRVSAEVDERYVGTLRPGMYAEILPIVSSASGHSATVSYVAQAVDPRTGAATVRLAYENSPADVLIGTTVDVNISVDTIRSAIIIPRESVGGGGARPFVLVVADGRVARREVIVDEWPAPLVVVRSGLEAGEHVLVDPKGAAVGARVRVRVIPDAL